MHSLTWKLTRLGSAVLLVLAVANHTARAGDDEPAGIVRLARIGTGAVEQTGGTCAPGAPCAAGSCAPAAAPCGTPGCGAGCDTCAPKKRCCLPGCCLLGCCLGGDDCDDDDDECEDECDDGCFCTRMLGLGGHGHGAWGDSGYGYGPYGSAAEARLAHLRCRFGYFIPSGDCGQGLPWAGHYGLVYPLNPDYFDPRDGRIYAAQGYGTPIATPLAPNVEFTYNYGWGIPSSRLTPVSRHVPGTMPITWPIPPGQRY